MLTEILCDKFIDDGKERGPIRFKRGLNVVLGDERATNSIGKSTLLLAVDFAFGGSTYAQSDRSMLEEVGHHEIKFTHRIDGTDYRFSRTTAEPKAVRRCGKGYEPAEKMSLDEFNSWMSNAYGLADLGDTFRYLVGPFFRVYGKAVADEAHPLQAHPSEGLAKGVDRLVKLYGKFGTIADLQRTLENVKSKQKAFRDAKKYNFIRAAANKTEYERNESRIGELQDELSELVKADHDNLADLEPLKARRLADLKARLAALNRQRTRLQSQLDGMANDLNMVKFSQAKDFSELQRFFPDADIRSLEQIEEFHRGLVTVLKSEHRELAESIESQVQMLNSQIDELESAARSIGAVSNLTEAVLESYASLSGEIERLRDANDAYEEETKYRERVRDMQDNLDKTITHIADSIELQLNGKLQSLNAKACGKSRSAPRMHLRSPKKYEFEVPLDVGTGSNVRGMALLDLALLEQTPLPAIAHDSVWLKHVEDDVMANLFVLYNQTEKQAFIAIDKASSYPTTPEVLEVLNSSTVLHLSADHELFGRYWATEEEAARREESASEEIDRTGE